jgi:hypothetical protein
MTSPARLGVIADALTDWLNDAARNWPVKQWKAKRTWEPDLNLEDAGEAIDVQVSADARTSQPLLSRGTRQRDATLFIDFRQKYLSEGAIPTAWIDERVGLAEAVDDALEDLKLVEPAGRVHGLRRADDDRSGV